MGNLNLDEDDIRVVLEVLDDYINDYTIVKFKNLDDESKGRLAGVRRILLHHVD